MFLSGVLFILFLAGCWLLCLTDVATTPAAEFPGLRKRTWIAVIAVTFVLGAIAWHIARARRRRARRWPQSLAAITYGLYDGDGREDGQYPARPMTAEAALARHPASQARRAADLGQAAPIGPDDDPDFLRELSERIRGEQ